MGAEAKTVMPMKKVSLLRAACCVAGLDREIEPKEQELLERLAFDAGVGQASLQAMMDRAKSDPQFFEQQFELIRTEADSTMKLMFEIAMSDGELTLNERVVLQHFATKLGMEQAHFDELLASAERQLDADRGKASP